MRDLFEIKAGEGRRFILLYLFVFVVTVSVIWGGAASDSFFLTIIGPEFLPFLFIINAFLTILTVTIYGAFVDRLSNTFLMVAIALLGGGALVLARLGLNVPDFNPVYWALYLLSRVLKDVISIHAWTFIADFYDTRTAKRHYPLLGSASRTAGILGGALIGPITTLFRAEGLVLAWMAALVASGLMAFIVPRLVRTVTEVETDAGESTGVIQNMRDGFGFVASSGFLRFMAGAALVGTILLKLLEFQTQTIFAEQFDSPERLATLLGQLQVVGNLITLPIQMFFLSRLVSRIGVGNANLIFPGTSALAYGLLLAFKTLPMAIFGYIDYEMLRSAFRTPINSLMYNAVPPAVKGRARAFINGLLLPSGLLIAGLMLLGNTLGLIPLQVLIVIGIITAVAYIAAALGARAQYGRSLATLLSGDEMSLFRLGTTEQADPAALKLLHWRLAESEDDDMTVFLLEVLYDFEGFDALPRLLRFATQGSAKVRAGATRIMAIWANEPEVRELCLDGLKHEDAIVREASAAALADTPNAQEDDILLNSFLEMLDDPEEIVQSRVIPLLIASGDFFYLAPAVEVLNGWLTDETNVQSRAWGLRVLADTGSERLLRTLVRYLNDPSPLVRRQAVELIDDLAAQTPLAGVKQLGLETLQSLLTDDDESVRVTAVNGLGRFRSPAASRALLIALSDPSFEVRRHACDAMQPILKRELEDALDSPDHHLAECAAFILARANHARAKRQVLELMDALVTNAYRLNTQQLALEHFDTTGTALLNTTLKEKADQFIMRAFWLLGSFADEEEAEAIRRSLQSDVVATRANATETLEAMTTPHLARLIAPLFENILLDAVVQKGREALELETPTEWQVFQLAWPHLDTEANPWDLTSLPDSQRGVMRLMLREVEMTYVDLREAIQTLPDTESISLGELDEVLAALTQDHWLALTHEDRPDTYKLNLRRKPGASFAQAIWATMTDKNLNAFYSDSGGWLTAITIYALMELSATMPDSGEQHLLSPGTLRAALKNTLEAGDTSPLVEETARLGLTLLGENGRDAVEARMLTTIEKVIFLKQVPFFQTMTTDHLRIFASISEEATFEEGERIITEGDRGDTLYVIINGNIAIQRRTQRRQGEDVTRLATLGPREYFAEMSVFDSMPYSADAEAMERTDLLLVRQAPLMALIQNQPDLALGLLKVLSVRLRQANEVIAQRSRTRSRKVMDLLDDLD
jgi:CRP-like cAMP-binding protein/HEAT repeat protein